MSTETVTDMNEYLVFLDTMEIIEPDATNVRPWSSKAGDTEAEIKRIEVLAATIEEEGQIQPVKVRKTVDGVFELIAGRRRKKAIELINAGRKSGEELKVKAVVSDTVLTDPSAFRQAAIENWHREGLSPMDMAMDIKTVRGNFDWKGSKGTKKVAEFFKVSPATVTQYETLLSLPEELQAKVHAGDLSRDDAFRLSAIADKKGVDAATSAAAAGEAAAEEVAANAIADANVNDPSHAHETPDEKADRLKKAKQAKKAKAAKSKAIKDKAREAGETTPRSKKDIIEFFTSCYGPAYGYPNGAVHQFVDALEKYAAGTLSDRTLYRYWDACVDKASKGTADSVIAKASAEIKAAADKNKSKTVVTATAGKTKTTKKTITAKKKK